MASFVAVGLPMAFVPVLVLDPVLEACSVVVVFGESSVLARRVFGCFLVVASPECSFQQRACGLLCVYPQVQLLQSQPVGH